MRSIRFYLLKAAFVVCTSALLATTLWAADQEKVLHSFGNGEDGIYPFAGLVFDAAGNLYGTTNSGGIHNCDTYPPGCGMVFELSPKQGGGWTKKVLPSFDYWDGAYPTTGLIIDAAGNLYGTTPFGGIHGCFGGGLNCGTVFELSPNGSGGWTEKVLHSFNQNGTDGFYPYSNLIFDAAGNLYGTTYAGGIHNYGTVFEITP